MLITEYLLEGTEKITGNHRIGSVVLLLNILMTRRHLRNFGKFPSGGQYVAGILLA
jgi:hypothetical protein